MTTPAVVEKQVVDIDFKRGLNEASAPEDLDWTKYLKVADNVDFGNQGRMTPRSGLWAFNNPNDDTGTTLTPIHRLLATSNGLLAICGTGFNVCHLNESGGDSTSSMVRKNRASEYAVYPQTVTGNAGNYPQIVGCAYSTNYNVIVYSPDSANFAVYYVVWIDKTSGNIVRKYQIDAPTVASKCVMAMDSSDVLCVFVGNGSNCYLYRFSAALVNSTATTPSPITLTSGVCPIAAVAIGSSVYCVQSTGHVNKFTGATENAQATVAGFSNVHDAATDGTKLYIIGNEATPRGLIKVVDSTLAVTRTVTDTDATLSTAYFSIGVDTSSNAYILAHYMSATGSYNTPVTRVLTCTSGATIFTTIQAIPGWGQVSAPMYNATTGEWFAAIVDLPQKGGTSLPSDWSTTDVGGACVIINLSAAKTWSANPVGFHIAAITDRYLDYVGLNNTGAGGSYRPGLNGFSAQKLFTSDSGKSVIFGAAEKVGPDSYTAEMRTLKLYDTTQIVCSSDVISGGKTGYYDGIGLSEMGFVGTPRITAVADAAGSAVPAGTYLYTCIFEFVDATGRRHVSRCANPFTYTSVGTKDADVTINFPAITDHVNLSQGQTPSALYNVRYAIYRTVAGGTQYFRLTSNMVSVSATTTTTIAYTDQVTDAILATRPLLHRQPGTLGTPLDRYYAPSSSCVVRHKDRIFLARGSDVFFSSFDVWGEAPWFNPAFSFSVPGGSGNITGLASLDGLLVIFKKNAIFVVDGDGPPENGGNGTEFSPPRKLPSNVGCVDARTIVPTNEGIMFRSFRGIERLSRNLTVDWVGERVADTLDSNPYQGGAAFDPGTGRAIWLMSAYADYTYTGQRDPTNDGLAVVYDTSSDTWSRYKLRSVAGYGKSFQDVVCAEVGSGNFSITRDSRFVFADTAKVFFEQVSLPDAIQTGGGTTYYTVPYQLETGWVKPQSKQDRIRLTDFTIAAIKGGTQDATLAVSYAADYSTSYTAVKTWTASNLNALGTVMQLETQPPKESVQAMSFRIVGETTTASGLGYPVFFGLSVRIGVKGGGAKLPSAQKG